LFDYYPNNIDLRKKLIYISISHIMVIFIFMNNKMDRYNEFLSMGREILEKFRDHKKFVNITGIDDSLVEPYLSQIIELNKYMNTTASTVYPDQLCQQMYVHGWIHRSYVTQKFLQKMNELNYDYTITKVDNCCKSQKSVVLYENHFNKATEHLILMNMLCKWWFNKSEECIQFAIKELVEFRNNYNNDLPEYFRDLYKSHNFLDCLQFLDDTHWMELENIKNTFPDQRYKLNNYHVGDALSYANTGACVYCCDVKDLIENGEILWIKIANYYDPTNRNLYADLLDMFKH
jgi:hypothetical protein